MEKSIKKVRTPSQKRGMATKAQIMEAGENLFSEKGYYKTNSKEIAEAAGISIGSFYAYFEDKKVLFLEILKNHYKNMSGQLTTVNTKNTLIPGNERAFISAIIDSVIKMHTISPGFHRQISIIANEDPDIKHIVLKEEEKIQQNTLNLLLQHKDLIRVGDIETAAIIISRSIEEIVHTIIFSQVPFDQTRLVTELVDMISRYLFAV